jgi:hypothetical protein
MVYFTDNTHEYYVVHSIGMNYSSIVNDRNRVFLVVEKRIMLVLKQIITILHCKLS